MTRKTSYLLIASLLFLIALLSIYNWKLRSELRQSEYSRDICLYTINQMGTVRVSKDNSNYNYLTKGGSDERVR